MANIKSAKKRALLSERNRQRNVAYKSSIKTAVRRVMEGLVKSSATPDELKVRLARVYSLVDRAVLKGILHKNTGARVKARITLRVQKQAAASA